MTLRRFWKPRDLHVTKKTNVLAPRKRDRISSRPFVLRQHIFNDVACDIREAIVPTSVSVRELLVVESHEMQNCRVEVMNVNRLFDGAQTVFVGRSMDHASYDSGTGQP